MEVRILILGDVMFFFNNRLHKEWLNRNKHQWSKQLHLDLEATPSTYMILAHGIPIGFDMETATSRITLESDNSFLAKKIFRLRWLGRSPNRRHKTGRNSSNFTLGLGASWSISQATQFIPQQQLSQGQTIQTDHTAVLQVPADGAFWEMVQKGGQMRKMWKKTQDMWMSTPNSDGRQNMCYL